MIGKTKNQIYHSIIGESVFFTAGLCLLIIGLFYNYTESTLTNVQKILFITSFIFFVVALISLFVVVLLCIKFNTQSQMHMSIATGERGDYDTETGIMYPEAFYKKVREYTLLSTEPACMVAFHAENIEQLYRSLVPTDGNNPISSFASVLVPTRQDTFYSAIKSRHEFLVFIYSNDKSSILETIDKMHHNLNQELQNLIPDCLGSSIECGYTWYPEQGKTLNELITNTSFALFEAICFNKQEKNEFTPSSYQKQKLEFKRNDRFEQLMDGNCFTYHYQPIVSAKTGEIYAYEALMRTGEDIGLSPVEILEIAERQNRLYEIEYYTFFNILKAYQKQKESFDNKYIFINCLPNQLLNKEDFDTLYKQFNQLTPSIVVEASEYYVHTEEDHLLLMERLHTLGSPLALDDYGSGYANEINLVKYNPKYIKIDRSLISGIDQDEKKQHLVSNIIQFAKLHGMISLAEGVETFKELQTAIFLGVDLLQGFYLHRPSANIAKALSTELQNEIAAINLKFLESYATSDTYISDNDSELDIESLREHKYSMCILNTKALKLTSRTSILHRLSITIPDNSKLSLEIENINLHSTEGCCINIGRNCQVSLILSGNNLITGQGILVPESSKLTITGNGNLTITTVQSNSIGIGESPYHAYGSITIDIKGKLAIHNKMESAVCIGGGKGSENSKIELLGGKYALSTDGVIGIAVGCIDGQANVELGHISMNIISNGTNSLGIGSLNGSINLVSSADLTIKLTGQNSCCIGVLSNQKGNILLQDGTVKIKLNAQHGCAIGSLDGSVYIKLALLECICLIQGINMCGIGNYAGSGITEIIKGTISVKLAAASKMYLGSQNGPLLINGGNINCPLNKQVRPINKYRIPLRHYRFTDCSTFSEHVEIDNLAYDYEANTTDYVKDINVFLPEFREYEEFLVK